MHKFPIQVLIPVASVGAIASPVWAQGVEFGHDAEFETVLVVSPGRSDAGEVNSETVLAGVYASLKGEAMLSNGVEVGAKIAGGIDLDHPARAGFSGVLGDGTLVDPSPLRGAFTGLSSGGTPEEIPAQGQIEQGYVYVKFGHGEVRGGIDRGVAARFFRGGPDVFEWSNTAEPRLDTSGVASVITRPDLTGPSAKVTYTTPRLLGFRAGVSYTPQANRQGLDRDPARQVDGTIPFDLEHAVEVSANVSRPIKKLGARLRASVSYSRANIDQTDFEAQRADFGPEFDRPNAVDVVTVGGSLEGENVTVGGSWLTSSNGGGRYSAWNVGIGGKVEKAGGISGANFNWSANYGQSRDDLTQINGDTWSAGHVTTPRNIP